MMLSVLNGMKEEIANEILRVGSTENSGANAARNLSNAPLEYFEMVRVLENGTILSRGAMDGQILVLIPSLVDGSVEWQCVGGVVQGYAIAMQVGLKRGLA